MLIDVLNAKVSQFWHAGSVLLLLLFIVCAEVRGAVRGLFSLWAVTQTWQSISAERTFFSHNGYQGSSKRKADKKKKHLVFCLVVASFHDIRQWEGSLKTVRALANRIKWN